MMDISLALGGGGARGLAHIGVIRQLEKKGISIKAVAGTSAGGIVAAFFAAGIPTSDMEILAREIDQAKLLAINFNNRAGILSLKNVENILNDALGSTTTFRDLRIPCAVVAVDIKTAREVLIQDGSVVDAILATIAIPGVFPPKNIADMELVDGGVLNPVPVNAAKVLAPRLPVIASILSPAMDNTSKENWITLPYTIPTPIKKGLAHLSVARSLLVFMQSVEIGQRMIAEMRLKMDVPDVVIRPDVYQIGLLDRVDVATVIRLGEEAAQLALPDILQSLRWTNKIKRYLRI